MLAPPTSHDAITRHLEEFPAELYPSHHEKMISNDPITTAKSQPLPALDVSPDGSNISIKVGDFGHCTPRCSLFLISSPFTEPVPLQLAGFTSSCAKRSSRRHYGLQKSSSGIPGVLPRTFGLLAVW